MVWKFCKILKKGVEKAIIMEDEQRQKRLQDLVGVYRSLGERALSYIDESQWDNLDEVLTKRDEVFDYIRLLVEAGVPSNEHLLSEIVQQNKLLQDSIANLVNQTATELQKVFQAKKSIQKYRSRRMDYSLLVTQT
jgi:hypothetical protein